MGNSADNRGTLGHKSAGGGAVSGEALPVVGAWEDSEYLACCRQRAAELRETGACITPLVAPDNRHVDPVVARNTHSKGRAASRDRYYERAPARQRQGGAR